MSRKARWKSWAAGALGAVLLAASGTSPASAGLAGDNPFERGPAPTEASVEAEQGPFAVATEKVGAGQGFGGGTISFPTDTGQGTFGAVAVAPGFLEAESAIAWYGPRLASQGFVVITIATNSVWDTPDARSEELLAALRYVTDSSQAKDRVDRNRLAVMGHSMGGGGTLIAARKAPTLKAAIPLTGWSPNTSFSDLRVPTFVVSAQNDFIAPDGTFSRPFYQSLPSSLDKAYLLLAGAGHLAPTKPNTTIAEYSISWLKRFVDEDTRYERFLCPLPTGDPAIAAYRGTCPLI
ncbi:dienelactone hydrolase family protein [Amycolatopsis sp. SID8362]|uniref:dienelactone hydrolase family protein n=1 Tax=Amycolatopsis sp. SID8362 TaxID=2690346 RepID=UPI00136D892B|nr:dienelactone hydrolase family protein [Amycolatopsis sp. SID8362]NBH11300.1 alpha/beta hydrolase [Amycolatopsis sp. SID8362]NED47992.1 alpha/beta hydrolase [Amycolatopsis sp. SID8362]